MSDWKHLTEAVAELEEEEVLEILKEFVAAGATEEEGQEAIAACQAGMGIVGDRFETGEYYVGDLIYAGELLTDAINILKPVIGKTGGPRVGTIVVGTVHGDLHDIGKNIFRSMSEAAGFEVHDLGIDTPAVSFIDKIKETGANIVGMSGILTLAIESMRDIIHEINKAGIRNDVKVIIGGNPVTSEACEYVGADAFTTNAAEGVKICQGWVK